MFHFKRPRLLCLKCVMYYIVTVFSSLINLIYFEFLISHASFRFKGGDETLSAINSNDLLVLSKTSRGKLHVLTGSCVDVISIGIGFLN